jgi:MFS family permease
LLLGALVTSATGGWAVNVALFAFVYDRTHSFAWVGAVGAVRFLSALICSPFGGVVAERTERIRLMVSADLACAIFQAGAAAAAAAAAPVVVVVILAALTTAVETVYPPAVAATIPSIVDEDDLVAANALNGTIDNLVVIAGPAIGAALLIAGSPALVFGVNAATFAFSAGLVSRIRIRTQPIQAGEAGVGGILRQMAVGLRTMASLPAARTLTAFAALVSFLYGTDTVLFVAVSVHRLGTGSRGYGYLLAGLGVGGLVMAGAVDRLGRSSRLALIILGGTLGYCLPTALLAIIHSPELVFAVEIVRGAATLLVDVLAVTQLQRAVPGNQLARVFGIYFALMLGAIALGAAITPAVISAVGLTGALLTMAFVPAALALLGLPALRAIDRKTAAAAAALAPRVALLQQLDIFATASRPLLERLAGSETEVEFPAERVIVHEGEPADAMYVLAGGKVEVTARGERGEGERHVRTMSAPSYFGEIGVLEHVPRTATVTAVIDCRCERIEGEALLEALTTAPASSSLMENVRSRLAITHPSRIEKRPEASQAAVG